MWISRKKFQNIEKRIADLEKKVRSQQKEITSLNYPYQKSRKGVLEADGIAGEKTWKDLIAI